MNAKDGGAGKKQAKKWLDFVRRVQGWNVELISHISVTVDKKPVMFIFYKQISDNPEVAPCFRYELIVDDEHKGGGVIR